MCFSDTKVISNPLHKQAAYGRGQEGTYDDPTLDYSVILPLSAGQQVWQSPSGIVGMQGVHTNGMVSWFSGHLIYAF